MASMIDKDVLEGTTVELSEAFSDAVEDIKGIASMQSNVAFGVQQGGQDEESRLTAQAIYSKEPIDLDLMLYTVERRNRKKGQCVELILYILFVIVVFLWLTFSTQVDDGYYMNVGLKYLFLNKGIPPTSGLENQTSYEILRNFGNIQTPDEFFRWTEGVLLPGLFSEEHYDGGVKPRKEKRYIQLQNRLFGSVRIRQLRVSNTSCTRVVPFTPNNPVFDTACYAEYSDDKKDTQPFGPNGMYKYQSCDKMGGGYTYNGRRLNYECGGYPIFISLSADFTFAQAKETLYSLRTNRWLDKQSRAVFIEFFSHNMNLNYFVRTQLMLEMAEGGSYVPSWNFRVFKLETLRTNGDYVWFAFSMLLPFFVMYYIYEMSVGVYQQHKTNAWYYYFWNFWNIIDTVNICLFVTTFILRIMWFVHPERTNFRITNTGYPNLEDIAFIYVIDLQVAGINAIITCLKTIKYFSINDTLNCVVRTLETAWVALVGTGAILLIIVCAFVFSGNILFGADIYDFKDLLSAFSAMLRVLIEDFGYEDWKEKERILLPVYFLFYICIALFCVMPMFEAVINDSFGEANENATEETLVTQEDVQKFVNGIVQQAHIFKNSILGLLNKNHNPLGTQAKYLPLEKEHHVVFNHGDKEIINKLKDFQEKKSGEPLTYEDVWAALGHDASKAMVDRIMARFDRDNSGTIELKELEGIDSLALSPEEEEKKRQAQKEREEQAKLNKNVDYRVGVKVANLEKKLAGCRVMMKELGWM